MNSIPFIIFIAIPAVIFSVITILLGKYKGKRRLLKYIPSIIAAAVTVFFFIQAKFYSEGFEALGNVVMMMIAGVVFLISIITAIIAAIINRRKRKYRQ